MAELSLTSDERTALERLTQTTRDTRVLKRAQALLWLDADEPLSTVARRLLISRQTIYSWIAMYQARANEPLVTRLADRSRSRPGQGRTWLAARTLIQSVIDQPPSSYGYDVPLWTTPLLQDFLKAEGVTTSTRYIRSILRALSYRAKRPRYRLARRSPTWRQAKGGFNAG